MGLASLVPRALVPSSTLRSTARSVFKQITSFCGKYWQTHWNKQNIMGNGEQNRLNITLDYTLPIILLVYKPGLTFNRVKKSISIALIFDPHVHILRIFNWFFLLQIFFLLNHVSCCCWHWIRRDRVVALFVLHEHNNSTHNKMQWCIAQPQQMQSQKNLQTYIFQSIHTQCPLLNSLGLRHFLLISCSGEGTPRKYFFSHLYI